MEWEGSTGHMHSTSYLLEYHRDVHQPRVEVRAKGICLWAGEERTLQKQTHNKKNGGKQLQSVKV